MQNVIKYTCHRASELLYIGCQHHSQAKIKNGFNMLLCKTLKNSENAKRKGNNCYNIIATKNCHKHGKITIRLREGSNL